MATVANRLIAYGVVTCLAGILFRMVATHLVGLLYEALPPQTVIPACQGELRPVVHSKSA